MKYEEWSEELEKLKNKANKINSKYSSLNLKIVVYSMVTKHKK